MVTGIIGRKVGMTQIFDADGTVHPATVIKAGPCVVVQAKNAQTDGYEAVQLGLVEETPGQGRQADGRALQEGQRAADARAPRGRSSPPGGEAPKVGDQVLASIFANGERVDVIGTGRGKGFQGVVKRHHFAGGAATHGSMFHRAPGSIGASSFPSRVVKGMRAAGRMGGGRVTIHNLKVLRVDPENHLLIVEGGIPGAPTELRDRPQGGHGQEAQGRAGREAEEGQEVGTLGDAAMQTMQLMSSTARTRRSARVDVRDEVFGGRVNADLIWESVVHANAAERRGTHATKNRALVSGSGKKPWRQKGTGRARVGRSANPLWRHGGTVFGPQPRSYDFKLPKKVERGALRAALAEKMQDGALVVVDALTRGRGQDEGGGRDAEAARRRPARRCSSTWRSTRSCRGRCATSPAWRSCRARRVTARDVDRTPRARGGDARRAREAAGGRSA